MTADAPTLESLLARWGRLIWRAVYRYARYLRLDREELHAEAVAIMVRRFGSFDPYRERASFARWSLLIVRSVAYGLCNSRIRRREVSWDQGMPGDLRRGDGSDPDALMMDPDAPDPAEEAAENEIRERAAMTVAAALAALPAKQRAAVRARFWDGALLSSGGRAQLNVALASLRVKLPRPTDGG